MITFAVVGGGWRAEFYLRIARLVPGSFNVAAVYVRNPLHREYIAKTYGVNTVATLEELLDKQFDFIVNCVSYNDVSDFSLMLADKGYYVLSETPACRKMDECHCYEKIQVAEQYHKKGTYQALKRIIESGVIGDVLHINISTAHDYHAMSIIRFLFNDYDEPQKLGDYHLNDSMLITHGRQGEFIDKNIENRTRRLMVFDFNSKIAIYDYNQEQYFSPIRRDRLLIRGTMGEIDNNTVRYFNREGKLIESQIVLKMSGLLEGFYNSKIVFEDKTLYEFPFNESRLSEEETSIAECLLGMKRYIDTGEEFYSYKRAYEDFIYFTR